MRKLDHAEKSVLFVVAALVILFIWAVSAAIINIDTVEDDCAAHGGEIMYSSETEYACVVDGEIVGVNQ